MNILITNDDGIDFKGLRTLVEEFSGIGDVYVVAPQGECSSNSHHMTIKGKIRYEEREVKGAKKAYALWGTPADCTHMALYYFFFRVMSLKHQIDGSHGWSEVAEIGNDIRAQAQRVAVPKNKG